MIAGVFAFKVRGKNTMIAVALGYAAFCRMPSDAPRARLELEEARSVARATGIEYLMGYVACLAALALALTRASLLCAKTARSQRRKRPPTPMR